MDGHGHGPGPRLAVPRGAARLVVGLVVLAGLLSLVAIVHWWPDEARYARLQGSVPATAPGVRTVQADLVRVRATCQQAGRDAGCGPSSARIESGSEAGRTVRVDLTPDVVATGLQPGDRVLLDDLATGGGAVPLDQRYAFDRADRGGTLFWLAVLFVLCVLLVARLRGLMALVSLAFAGLVVLGFLVPALLTGRPALPVTAAAAVVILIVMLYATHGPSLRTSVALVGALAGIGLAVLYAWLAVLGAHLGGLGDDAAVVLESNAPAVRVQQLVVASVVLAGLGVLNDVTVTQASALWELRAAAPDATRWELFRAAMRIGRDHVASNVYTLVFAYLGTALLLLVAVQLAGGTPLQFATSDEVAQEVVRSLVGAIALILAMPITTAIGAAIAGAAEPVDLVVE